MQFCGQSYLDKLALFAFKLATTLFRFRDCVAILAQFCSSFALSRFHQSFDVGDDPGLAEGAAAAEFGIMMVCPICNFRSFSM